MKYLFSVLVVCLALSSFAFGQSDEKAVTVTALNMPANSNAGEISGNIKDGQKINLRWAESSQVACFPGTRFEMFNGNNVFYRVTLPAASSMKITVTPSDGKAINLYALRQGLKDQVVPPNVTSAISCEASYPIYANVSKTKRVTNKDDGTRKVEYISVNSAYSILIGVAGAEGLTDGDFKLKIEINPR